MEEVWALLKAFGLLLACGSIGASFQGTTPWLFTVIAVPLGVWLFISAVKDFERLSKRG